VVELLKEERRAEEDEVACSVAEGGVTSSELFVEPFVGDAPLLRVSLDVDDSPFELEKRPVLAALLVERVVASEATVEGDVEGTEGPALELNVSEASLGLSTREEGAPAED